MSLKAVLTQTGALEFTQVGVQAHPVQGEDRMYSMVCYDMMRRGIAAHLVRWEDGVGGEDVPGKRGERVEPVGKEREGEGVPASSN